MNLNNFKEENIIDLNTDKDKDEDIQVEEEKYIEQIETQNLNEIFSQDKKREEPQAEEFYSKDKESLMLYQETKHEMFEKLRINWASNHKRIQDFNQKRMMKFPQIYYLNYQTIYDPKRNITENKSNLCSKYTFNLDNDVEIDLGGKLFSRDNMGIGSIFSSLRFYSFRNKLFNSLSYSFGEMKDFTYETNYLFSNTMLLDYIYKKKSLTEEHKHKVTLHKLFTDQSKANAAFTVTNNFEDFNVNLCGKKYLKAKTQSLEGKVKIGTKDVKLIAKFKENVVRNLYLMSSHKIAYNAFFPIYSSRNEVVYKYNNRFFNFGYFYNFDGLGLEVGYRSGGVMINLPFVLFKGDFNVEEEINKSFHTHLLSFAKQFIIFAGLNFVTKLVIKKIKQYLKHRSKGQTTSSSSYMEKLKRNMIEVRNYQEKIVMQISSQAEKNQKIQSEKKFGLIINFAIYGQKRTLKKIMNEFHLIDRESVSDYLKSIVSDVENEVIDVTVPVRYLIRTDEKTSIASILFHQVPKTKIVGFVNPIFKSDKEPALLLSYSIGGNTYTIIKMDREFFQIPQTFNM